MQQFSIVLRELRKWYELFRWYPVLASYELILLFGGLGVLFLEALLYAVLPGSSYHALDIMFNVIPLGIIAHYAFWVGAWLTLASSNIKYLPYALWINALLILFPFRSFSLGTLVSALVYAVLGYLLFKYTASSYSSVTSAKRTHQV
ncbi:hypothetical protein [Paenibacillus pini]|uniref:Uncharacterized protein n=1 Tax=Paenibacillus pini JCM 16418 TaxID=1236976 RepID=W7YQ26_9BACL|nr:hypothetical protein [Paenibacillus pini]GAF09588.1 hypothetical protein JCM16418_3734 [Paenibacillus pini JCM 16418]